MAQPHQHAAVLKAIAEGKEVQFKWLPSDRTWDNPSHYAYNPLSNPNFEWRIKPEEFLVYIKEEPIGLSQFQISNPFDKTKENFELAKVIPNATLWAAIRGDEGEVIFLRKVSEADFPPEPAQVAEKSKGEAE